MAYTHAIAMSPKHVKPLFVQLSGQMALLDSTKNTPQHNPLLIGFSDSLHYLGKVTGLQVKRFQVLTSNLQPSNLQCFNLSAYFNQLPH
jgi:hypothetical protein